MDTKISPSNSDLDLVRLAREIAMDILPLETILKQYDITDETWSKLQANSKFRILLSNEVEAWSTALNTRERVVVKSAAMIEEWLPELNSRIHDATEPLASITKAGELLAKMAGIGTDKDIAAVVGERFVINISMGPKSDPLEFAKDVTSKVIIEHEGSVQPTPPRDVWGDAK
jgi:hypothetical protein